MEKSFFSSDLQSPSDFYVRVEGMSHVACKVIGRLVNTWHHAKVRPFRPIDYTHSQPQAAEFLILQELLAEFLNSPSPTPGYLNTERFAVLRDNCRMGEPLISVVCTANIASSILSTILTSTYDNDPDCQPALILLPTATKSDWEAYTLDSATQPPVAESFASPFVGMTAQQVSSHLRQNASGTLLNERYFFMADERTAEDLTLLLVVVEGERLRGVRVSGECANPDGVALTVGTMDFDEIESLVGEDGVYQG